MEIDKEINARGLNCPLPLMKAQNALEKMQSGHVLKVIATDSGSMRDFLAYAEEAGHEMLEQLHIGKDYIHVIRRA